MTEKKDILAKRERRRLLALLALAAEERKDPGLCLESEEIAELLDRRCSGTKQREMMAHISDCDVCYQEWLTLSQVRTSGERKNSGFRRVGIYISRRRYLTAVGSICAVAASIVVFLAAPVYHDEKPQLFAPLKEPAPINQGASDGESFSGADSIRKAAAPVPEVSRPVADKQNGNKILAAPAESRARARKIQDEVPLEAMQSFQESEENTVGSAIVQDKKTVKAVKEEDSGADHGFGEMVVNGGYLEYRQNLLTLCEDGEVEFRQITEIEAKSLSLLQVESGLKMQQRTFVEQVIILIESSKNQADKARFCQKLTELL